MTAGLVKRIHRKHRIDAWVGDEERLRRLVRVLNELVERWPKPDKPDAASAAQWFTRSYIEQWSRPQFDVTATERDALTIRGEAESVFAEMDRTALVSLEMEVAPPSQLKKRDQVRIEFDNLEGVTLESRGETSWVDEVHARLTEELDRRVPWWAWMRGFYMWLGITIAGTAEFWLLTESPRILSGDIQTVGGRIAMSLTIGVMIAGFLSGGVMFLIRRLIPGFEVVRAGEKREKALRRSR